MKDLTPRQKEVLAFVTSFSADNGMPPTRADIAKHFGWASANAAEDHLRAIARKGAVFILRGKARGVCVA